MFNLGRFTKMLTLASGLSLIFVGSSSAGDSGVLGADGIQCQSQWAGVVVPVINNIVGNAFGLFLAVAIPASILAIIGLVFFHWSRHRGVIFSFIGIVIFAIIAVQIWPGIISSIKPAGC